MINYYLLTKPGIIFGNLITMAAGFFLASKGDINLGLFFATLSGLTFIIASACVFNNYIDRQVDRKMERTRNRVLVQGLVTGRNAIFFGTILVLIGNGILCMYTNMLAVAIANVGFFVYVLIYSLWKGRTIYGTAIGSIAGAVPPVVGYCAVSNHFDAGALILFFMLVLWQMPHFFAIAIYHLKDYSAAGIPLLPVLKGVFRTKIHMLLYISAFIFTSTLLTFFNYTGIFYLIIALSIGIAWFLLGIRGFSSNDSEVWGCQMFRLSLVLISAICFVIPLDVVY